MLEKLCGECIGLLGLAQCAIMLGKHDDDDSASHSNMLRTHVAASHSTLTPDQVLIMLTKGCHSAARYQLGGGGTGSFCQEAWHSGAADSPSSPQ